MLFFEDNGKRAAWEGGATRTPQVKGKPTLKLKNPQHHPGTEIRRRLFFDRPADAMRLELGCMPSLAPRHQDRHRMAGLSVVSEGAETRVGEGGRPLRLSRLAGRPDALCVARAACFRVVHRMVQRFSAQSKEPMMMIRRGSRSLPPAADKKTLNTTLQVRHPDPT